LLLFSPLFLSSQDAGRLDSRLLLIPGILNEFDLSLNNLEANTLNSNRHIETLQSQVDSLLTSIEAQQKQLDKAWENSTLSEQRALTRSLGLESSLQSLEVSFRSSLIRTQELERENADLALSNARKDLVIFSLSGVIVFGVAFSIARRKIKRR